MPTDVAISVTQNIPANGENVGVSIRGFINGLPEGELTLSVPFGGSDSVLYVVPAGGSNAGLDTQIVFTATYRNNNTQIEMTAVHVGGGNNAAIDAAHFKLLFTYSQVRVVPGTAATTRDIRLAAQAPDHSTVLALKSSAGGNLIIESTGAEVDTGYAYTTQFGAGEDGFFETDVVTSTFFDYRIFDPTGVILTQLQNHSDLDQFGLFDTEYPKETVVTLDVTLRPQGLNVADLPTSATGLVSGDLWNNGGALSIV